LEGKSLIENPKEPHGNGANNYWKTQKQSTWQRKAQNMCSLKKESEIPLLRVAGVCVCV